MAAITVSEPVTSFRELPGVVWTPILTQDPVNPSVLSPASQPYDRTFWGYGPMPVGGFFELNIGVSGPVKVIVASVESGQTSATVFEKVGTQFFEPVAASGGTYQVQITNEGTNPVEILTGSNVIAQQRVTSYQTVYPYATWGSLTAALGVVLLVVGFLAKPKKRLSKR